ncbi:MAG: T9SS type A sorting domain-containing protein, partial [Saprospiraceae bacterium]|nr:T9SS type A sorting domain-containing protein [Saprospiraceae bacterium]
DGGYILGGSSSSSISGDKTESCLGQDDYWVVKLDASGAIQWQNTIGGNSTDYIYALQQTADGGYILGGSSNSTVSGDKTENCLGETDYWVIKLDATGAIQWQNTIGGNHADFLYAIHQTADGGYILGGTSSSGISGDKTENSLGVDDFWVVKLDASGTIQWQNTIGGTDSDYLLSLQQTFDGGYILGGWSFSNISGDKTENSLGVNDFWVVKLDGVGNIQWQNTIGGDSHDGLSALQQTADGGYILGGSSNSDIYGDKTENSLGDWDYWVVKLDAAGAIQWQNTIGGNYTDEFNFLDQTSGGGYILGGWSISDLSGDKTENSLGNDFWIVKLNAMGAIQWENTIGGVNLDQLYSIQQTADGGFILGGLSNSNISGDKTENCLGDYDFWVIKLAPESVSTGEAPTAPAGITIYPNPTIDAISVRSEAATTLCLRNAFGHVLTTQNIQGQGKIDISGFPNGIYFLVEMETGIGHKIVKNN